jgi:ABC-2 type transport system ATP-binding protein
MPQPILQVDNLVKHYGDVQAVRGVSFSVDEGEVFGLLGPNGAGKTTTVEILEGLRNPDGGSVRVCGFDPQVSARELKHEIGASLQSTSLPDKLRVMEALRLFAGFYKRRRDPEELLRRFGLEEKRNTYYSKLSGGQKQRLALAMALLNDPRVLFLDEPTAGLDPQGRRSLWDVVRGMKAEGRTTMLTTHYMDEAEALCDRLAIIDHGRILRSGTPAELIASLGIPSVVELTFDGAAPDPGAFAARLGVAVEARGGVWEIPTPDPKAFLPQLLAATESERLGYSQVHVRRATLEDVFLQLTGRSLRD